ncbi:MAG: HEAT repeat domain-containing protein [Deltaproteobacteria bacterium]|nr:HEAT repeat domain-containing protein [Deltaproteobacteria bacterium]
MGDHQSIGTKALAIAICISFALAAAELEAQAKADRKKESIEEQAAPKETAQVKPAQARSEREKPSAGKNQKASKPKAVTKRDPEKKADEGHARTRPEKQAREEVERIEKEEAAPSASKAESGTKPSSAAIPGVKPKAKPDSADKNSAASDTTKTVESTPKASVKSSSKARARAPGEAEPKINFAQAKELLASAESDKVSKGIKYLKEIATPAIVAPLVARLRQGLPPALVESALDALGAAKSASAAAVLIELCEHRRATIRAAAIRALGELKIKHAYAVVRVALDDPDEKVRVAAVKALSQIGGRRALNDLFFVFERGNTGVVDEIAKWVTIADLDRLTAYMKEHSFGVLQPIFSELLNRKTTSIRDKKRIIARLGEHGTVEIHEFLRVLISNLPEIGRKPLSEAIGKAIQSAQKTEAAVADSKSEREVGSAGEKQEKKP